MKQKIITLFTFLLCTTIYSSAQTTIWKEDFESGGTNFELNTSDVIDGTTCRGINEWNLWTINKSYQGYIGTINNVTNCLNELTSISFGVQNTQSQPSSFTGYPQSNYLHIYSPFTKDRASIDNANWFYGYSTGDPCGTAGYYFTKMKTGVSTVGFSNVTLKFWWMNGAYSVYGRVYYSIDQGNTWTLITSPVKDYTGQKTWKQQSITLPAFDNQADIRFGFLFVNTSGTTAQRQNDASPAVSIDEISLEAPQCAAAAGTVSAVRDTICSGTPAMLNTAGGTGVMQWQSSLISSGGYSNLTGSGASLVDFPQQTTYYRVFVGSGACTDSSAPYKIIVNPSPVADFSFTVTGKHVVFTNNSQGATRYNWNFADGTPETTLDNPTHDYAADGTYYVCMDAFNGSNCSFRICKYVDIGGTGIADFKAENNWTVFPDPFNDVINISGKEKNRSNLSVRIYDLLGREVMNKKFAAGNNSQLQVNASALTKGMYILEISNSDTGTLLQAVKLIKSN